MSRDIVDNQTAPSIGCPIARRLALVREALLTYVASTLAVSIGIRNVAWIDCLVVPAAGRHLSRRGRGLAARCHRIVWDSSAFLD
jgi:hypothetical protein